MSFVLSTPGLRNPALGLQRAAGRRPLLGRPLEDRRDGRRVAGRVGRPQFPSEKEWTADEQSTHQHLEDGMSHRSPKRARVEAPPHNQNDAAHRLIIALDLDAFYVSASRIRDPSLVGLPIGIKQKGILATCSYEARALGVQKLATIKESLRKCPELILVNGEDLSYFRKLSNQVWRLVKGIVWEGRVEKLGLDELFCDVTEMIDAQDDSENHPNGFFKLSKEKCAGFEYDHKSFAGHIIPDQPHEFPRGGNQSRRLLVASHLAAYLRDRIEHEIGLTASAGVAHNKLIAKLVCAKHKPAQQTVFAPPQADPLKVTLQFLDPYEARALNGFGGVICNTLRNALGGETLGHSGSEWLNGGLGPDPQRHIQEHRGEEDGQPPPSLPVSLCRKAFSATQFVDLFGSRLGPRLWCLLHGRDDEPVVPAPAFPLQLSIEDTYRNLRGGAVYEQMQVLSESLIRRLEAELVDDDEAVSQAKFELTKEPLVLPGAVEAEGVRSAASTESTTVRTYTQKSAPVPTNDSKGKTISRTWKRFPLSMRLSIRQGWDNRVSKQTRMPVEVL